MSNSAAAIKPSTAYALLAAGSARRFGGGKLLADLEGRPLWRWAADAAVDAGFSTRIIVSNDPEILDKCDGWITHDNPDAAEGIASSIRRAVDLAKDYDRLVIGLADMPLVEPEHLRGLALSQNVVFTRYPNGRSGVPAGFPKKAFPALATLTGDRGAAASLQHLPASQSLSPGSPEALIDVDVISDLEKLRLIVRR